MTVIPPSAVATIAPLLRGILARDQRPLLRFSSEPIALAITIAIPDLTDDRTVLTALRADLGDQQPPAIHIPGVGYFAITWPMTTGRMAGRIAVITGAAQGFGLEIAQGLARHGARVVLADRNSAGAIAAASAMNHQYGPATALGLAMDVTDGPSIRTALIQAVAEYGGIDLFIANAGVLKAASVKTQSIADFDFVTKVNYQGFFLCTQEASPILGRLRQACPTAWTDIIQINSKSGLQGSNRNGAYAGSKFGGIGLVQSFALELVSDGIKVNAICPGNFFDGPLWSDPKTGLFSQYLATGKVPGATTIADVRRFYEAKAPMNRGCQAEDVLRAVLYLVEQEYETGQALPVTGGQVMLK